ncbi:cache domain-containing protein [Telmatospirillum siberiense]|nr:cache domain-containing protein [Telmatospirillum siberiense]
MPLKVRLTVCFVALLAATVAILVSVMLNGVTETVSRAEERELKGYLGAVEAMAGLRTQTALALAEMVATMPDVQSAVADGDRARLLSVFSAPFARMREDAGVQQFQFHMAPATSFLRLHQPALFGDDLSSFRQMVVEANRRGSTVQGLENGVADLGARAIVPIAPDGKNIGSVEFGMDFGQEFAWQFKSRFAVDLAIHLPSDDGFRTVAATAPALLEDPDLRRQAFAGKTVLRRFMFDGRSVAALLAPINDYSGKPVAVAEITMDAGEYATQYAQARWRALGVGVVVLLAGVAIAWFISQTISRPLVAMTEAMHRLAEGDLGIDVPAADRADEIGRMARAMFVFKQNRAEIERQKAERDQFARLGILGEMASNIAHELNQPLASILNYGRGMVHMLDGEAADQAMLRTGAVAVAEQAERAAAIIHRIRGFVRRRPPHRVRVNVNSLAREALSLFETSTSRSKVPVRRRLAPHLPAVLGDKVEIQQVLLNLLQNALDATPDGGDILLTTEVADGKVTVSISDSGSGLAPGVEERMFDPFFTTKSEGLGLGLSICRTIVESHGGGFLVRPGPEGGVTIAFTLPALS